MYGRRKGRIEKNVRKWGVFIMVLSNKEWLDKMDEIISAIQNGGSDSQVIEDMLSNMWISSATYNVGDYVLYNNNIWKCLVQNSNIAPTEGSTWTKVIITNEISTLNSNFENKFAAIETDVTTTQKNISYPNGFNYNNCVVTTLYNTPYGSWVVPEHDQSLYGCELVLSYDGIFVTAKTNDTKKIRILLTRIDI